MNATLLGQLVQLNQRDQAAQGLNQAISRAAASFGTKEQQEAKMRALGQDGGGGGVGYGSTLDAIAKSMEIQGAARTAQEHQRMMQGAAGMASLLGTTPDVAVELANAGKLPEVLQTHFTNLGPTDQQKNANALGDIWARAQGWDPSNLTPEQHQAIEQQKASFLQNVAGGALDPVERQFRNEVTAWQNNPANKNQPLPDRLQNFNNYKAYQDTRSNALKILSEEKSAFGANDEKAGFLETNTAELQKLYETDPDAVMYAIKNPGLTQGQTGRGASYLPGGPSSNALRARYLIDTLGNQLAASNLQNNSRMAVKEFERVGSSMTILNNPNVSQSDAGAELSRIAGNAVRSRANIQAQAGQQLDPLHSRYAEGMYFNPEDPFYSGASKTRPVQVSTPDDVRKLPSGTPFVIPEGPHKGETGYAP